MMLLGRFTLGPGSPRALLAWMLALALASSIGIASVVRAPRLEFSATGTVTVRTEVCWTGTTVLTSERGRTYTSSVGGCGDAMIHKAIGRQYQMTVSLYPTSDGAFAIALTCG